MKKQLILFLLTIILLTACNKESGVFSVKINTEKKSLSSGDTISLSVKFKNISKEKQIIDEYFIRQLEYYLHFYSVSKNKTEILVPWRYRFGGGSTNSNTDLNSSPDLTVILTPLQEYEFTVNATIENVLMYNSDDTEYNGLAIIIEKMVTQDNIEIVCGLYYQIENSKKYKIQYNMDNILSEYVDNRFNKSNEIVISIK